MAADLDGTLLDAAGEPSDRTATVLRWVAAHATVVLATACPPRFVQHLGDLLSDPCLAICCNGAALYDISSDRILQERCLDVDTVGRIADRIRYELHGVAFGAVVGRDRVVEQGYLSDHVGLSGRIEDSLRRPATKLMVRCDGFTTAQLLDTVSSCVEGVATLHRGGTEGWLELTASGVDKGFALEVVANTLGIRPAETVAFGNMPNDIPMLRWAGVGVAVADGHPDVVSVADAVTCASHDDGVAEYLEALFNAGTAERDGECRANPD